MKTCNLIFSTLASAAVAVTAASAQTIVQTVDNVDWNTAMWGTPSAAPTSGNDYQSADGDIVRTDGGGSGDTTFDGDNLEITSGAALYLKNVNTSSIINGALTLTGGQIYHSNNTGGSSATLDVTSFSVSGNSDIAFVRDSLTITADLTGSGHLYIAHLDSTAAPGQTMFFSGINSFTGAITLGTNTAGARFPRTEDVTLDLGTDSYTFQDTVTILNQSVLKVNDGQTLTFNEGDLIDPVNGTVAAGTYSPSSLGANYTGDGIIVVAGTDDTDPTLPSSNFVDDQGGGPVQPGTTITYTITFSEDMDASTVGTDDFANAGTATFTFGSITEIAPGIFTLEITPDSFGTLQLEILSDATLTDAAGNPLDASSSAIVSDLTITVEAAPPPLQLDVAHDGTDLTLSWDSQAGNTYNLKTSASLSAAISTWHLLEAGIAATAPLNIKTMEIPSDPRRFYVLEENTDTTFGLWSGGTIPSNHTSIPYPVGLEHHTLLDGSVHPYHFLHGAAIINFKGVFYANWANGPTNENYPDETLQGRTFTDASDTNTWSTVEIIGSDLPGDDRRSHAAFLEHDGQLWTFAARFIKGAEDPDKPELFTGLEAEAFILNETSGAWESQGIVMDNCWPYEEPVLMSNGNYIVGGQDKQGNPVVAISHGGDLTQWDSVLIPYPPEITIKFGETTVWAEGNEVTAVIRARNGVAAVATSIDGGQTWGEARSSNMPMPAAKAFLGKLSTGQMYLVSNLSNRNTMIVSTGKPGETTLSKMWRIRYGSSSPVPQIPGFAKGAQWSYPYACEHDGKLYVVYSIGKEDCGLSVIPISSLANP